MFSFLQIFRRPGKVFDRVRQQKIWLAPFFVAVLCLTLPTVMVMLSGGGIELLTMQRYQNNAKAMEAVGGEEAAERAVNGSNEHWTKILIVSRVGGTEAAALILVALAFMLAASWLDERPNYFATLGTVSYAVFPFALAGAVITLIILSATTDHMSLDLENMPGLSMGMFLDRSDVNPLIFSMASGMDLLVGGEILLTSYGLTRLTRLTYAQALAICGGLWAIALLWKAAAAVYL